MSGDHFEVPQDAPEAPAIPETVCVHADPATMLAVMLLADAGMAVANGDVSIARRLVRAITEYMRRAGVSGAAIVDVIERAERAAGERNFALASAAYQETR